MSEAADLLGVVVSHFVPALAAKQKKSRPKGIPREVYDLIPDEEKQNMSPAPPQLSIFADKRIVGGWRWRPYSSTARTDGTKFYHWERKGVEYIDYAFAKFNRKKVIVDFDKTEFRTVHKTDWNYEEAQYLFSLCHDWNLCWPVIADRYDWNGVHRSIEECKQAFFVISKGILKLRKARGLEKHEECLFHFSYDRLADENRRERLDSQFYVSKETEVKMKRLERELEAIEAGLKKLESDGKKGVQQSSIVSGLSLEVTEEDLEVLRRKMTNLSFPEGPIPRSYYYRYFTHCTEKERAIIQVARTVLTELRLPYSVMGTYRVVSEYLKLILDTVQLLILQKRINSIQDPGSEEAVSNAQKRKRSSFRLTSKRKR